MSTFNPVQQHLSVSETKEEKIAAARQRLKQFKKEARHQESNNNNNNNNNTNNEHNNKSNGDVEQEKSERSSPSHFQSFNPSAFQQPVQFNNNLNEIHMSNVEFKEQLQLHVQTIGILVAEKAELQSKLQQASKKADRKQDECDELMGRLKASRQKILDLEKLVQQQQIDLNEISQSNSGIGSLESNDQTELMRVRSELSSNEMLIGELRMRLNESNEKLSFKSSEVQRLSHLNLDLKSQLEMLQLRIEQMNNSTENALIQPLQQPQSPQLQDDLFEKNSRLEKELVSKEHQFSVEKEKQKQEYQSYVEQFQRQIESLVDQINRMTDEREASFAKLDRLEKELTAAYKQNEDGALELAEIKLKLNAKENEKKETTANMNATTTTTTTHSKEQLLENEIKYFKQQIEILVVEHNNLVKLLEEKQIAVDSMNKLVANYEVEREQHARLLEQVHSDKQTLSRAIQQNKELKEQLQELQDAYVSVTKTNLDLTTQLQAEQFKLKQVNESKEVETTQNLNVSNSQAPSNEWDDEDDENAEKINNKEEKETPKSTLMQSVMERIEYLEKENKDLNDYIVLVNRQLLEKPNSSDNASNQLIEQNLIIDTHLKKIDDLNVQLNIVESERLNLLDKLNKMDKNGQNNSNDSNTNDKNLKLLEDKFNKVMQQNADLKEKNQELEHIIQQLQFETETIIDYITMYQMEREKLNKKYKIKDEAIRSLSTQLQVNKLALQEISNYFGTYLKYTYQKLDLNKELESEERRVQVEIENEKKKEFIIYQIQKLLNDVTNKSSSALNNITPVLYSDNQNYLSKISSSNGLASSAATKANNLFTKPQYNISENSIDPNSIAAFKSQVVLCGNCNGDLFVV